MERLRVAFMGSPDFSNPTLQALIAAGHDVVCAYVQPPRRAGRGQKPRPCPVHAFAEQSGIEVRTPTSLKSEEEQQAFRDLNLDAAIVVAYGLILPKPILDAPHLGCINVHASVLPRWRGAAPIQRAIMAGDTETGITIMKMDQGLDTGPVLAELRVPIGPTETGGSLHDTLSELGGPLLVDTLAKYATGEISPVPQPENGATYAKKLDKKEGAIDFAQSAIEIERRLRALTPWPGAFFEVNGCRVKVLEAVADPNPVSAAPGTVLDECLTIATGEGTLRPIRIQREGKGAMETDICLRGFPVAPGTQIACEEVPTSAA